MKSYIKNNIQFRIVSSNAIAKFKAGQAFDFNEITNIDSSFASATREVLLLEYEYCFKWIMRVEKLFLMLTDDEKPISLNKTLTTSIEYLFSDIEEVMSFYPELFDTKLIAYVEDYHNSYLEMMWTNITDALNNNVYYAYPKIVNIISTYLQQTMFILHDYDNNTISKKEFAFLSLTDPSVIRTLNTNKQCHLVNRADFFNKEFNINTFILKNYSSYTDIENIISQLTQHGLKIAEIKSIKSKPLGE